VTTSVVKKLLKLLRPLIVKIVVVVRLVVRTVKARTLAVPVSPLTKTENNDAATESYQVP
jgi:hypothetical protein